MGYANADINVSVSSEAPASSCSRVWLNPLVVTRTDLTDRNGRGDGLFCSAKRRVIGKELRRGIEDFKNNLLLVLLGLRGQETVCSYRSENLLEPWILTECQIRKLVANESFGFDVLPWRPPDEPDSSRQNGKENACSPF